MSTAEAQIIASITRKSVAVSDGIKLNVLEGGSGKTLVLVPGWSQTAEQFKYQLEALVHRYGVIAIDMRGRGLRPRRRLRSHLRACVAPTATTAAPCEPRPRTSRRGIA